MSYEVKCHRCTWRCIALDEQEARNELVAHWIREHNTNSEPKQPASEKMNYTEWDVRMLKAMKIDPEG